MSTGPRPRLDALDGLRGIAAIGVFVFHGWLYTMDVPNSTDRSGILEDSIHELRLGLVAFFVLSGVLLYRPWLIAALGAGPKVDLRSYAIARIARVAPAYYVCLVACIALLWSLDGTPGLRLPPADELPLFFVFGQNFSHDSVMKLNPPMWSLVLEVTFYLILPVLGLLAARMPRTVAGQSVVPILMIVTGLVFNWAVAGQAMGMPYTKSLLAMAFYFGLGMLGALILHTWSARIETPPWRRGLLAGGTVIVLVHTVMTATAARGTWDSGELYLITRDLLAAVGFTMIIVALSVCRRTPIMGAQIPVAMGTMSYGFYLWHVPIMVFMRGHGLLPMDPVLGTLVAFVPSVLIAWASWVVLERPAINWAARRNRRASQQRAEASDRDAGRGSAGVAVRA